MNVNLSTSEMHEMPFSICYRSLVRLMNWNASNTGESNDHRGFPVEGKNRQGGSNFSFLQNEIKKKIILNKYTNEIGGKKPMINTLKGKCIQLFGKSM